MWGKIKNIHKKINLFVFLFLFIYFVYLFILKIVFNDQFNISLLNESLNFFIELADLQL